MNLFVGFLALWQVMEGHFAQAIYLITACVILDGFDGAIARLTKTESLFGVQLDSLVDAISFGITPAVLINKWGFPPPYLELAKIVGFIFLSAGIIRLARFNVYKEANVAPPNIFIGLPIPFAAMAISSFILVCHPKQPHSQIEVLVFSLFSIMISLMMISTIRYRTAKNIVTKYSLLTLIILAVVIASLVIYPTYIIPILTLAYVISPIIFSIIPRKRKSTPKASEPPDLNRSEP